MLIVFGVFNHAKQGLQFIAVWSVVMNSISVRSVANPLAIH